MEGPLKTAQLFDFRCHFGHAFFLRLFFGGSANDRHASYGGGGGTQNGNLFGIFDGSPLSGRLNVTVHQMDVPQG